MKTQLRSPHCPRKRGKPTLTLLVLFVIFNGSSASAKATAWQASKSGTTDGVVVWVAIAVSE
jgi:hypothetical protein